MKRKILFVVIIALCGMLCICFSLTACDGNGGNKYSQGLTFKTNAESTGYLVTGLGECMDKDIRIPNEYNGSPVLGIDSGAFNGCVGITSIIIPDNVTTIDAYAFIYCRGLTSITIGNGVTTIGESAFEDCISLTSITIPDSVNIIGNSAFSGCRGLTSITIPNSVTSIGKGAFSECNSLTSITIPFVGNTINGTVNTHFGYIFEEDIYSSNGNRDVPASLKEVIITGGTTIADEAFYDCSGLIDITIPDSITTIGSSAFTGCDGLTIYCSAKSKPLGWDDYWRGECPVVWNYPNNETADDGNIYLVNNSIRYALKDGIATVCGQSTAISGNIEILSEITHNGKKYKVTTIDSRAFYDCSGLTSITIPDSVTTIGNSAFNGCSGLTSITIPDSVMTIGDSAFWRCSGLTIYCEAKSKPSGWLDSWAHNSYNGYDCPVVWGYPNNEVADDGNIYVVNNGIRYALKDGKATVCRQSTTISGNVEILSEVMHNGRKYRVTAIGDLAFYKCDALTSITIPDSVTAIGICALLGCYRLTSIVIPDSVMTIGDSAFDGCSNLTKVYYKGTAAQWNKISISYSNDSLKNATRYYYRETKPTTPGNYWHYVDGKVVEW